MYRLTCFLLILLPLIVIASDELSGLEGIEYVVVITGEDEDGDLIIAGVLNSIVQSMWSMQI